MSRKVVGAIGLALILALGQSPLRAETVVAEGIVRSEARVEIKSKVVAPIKRIAVNEGQVVRIGDLLVEMSNDVERSQVEAATAEVERARAALADAEQKKKTADRELERNLGVEDLITERDLELSQDAALQASTAFSMRQREFTKAEAHLALSTALYQSTFIRAPFTGQVSRIHSAVGAMPKPAETILLDLIALDRLFVEIAIPLEHLKRVKTGMPVKLVIEEGHPANEVRIDGRVSFIYPEIDPTIRMIRMKVQTDARGATIVPGMFAKASLEIEDLPRSP